MTHELLKPQPDDPAFETLRRAQSLLDDLSRGEVERFKRDNPGALAIGHMPIYTPRPLIEAIGALPVAVFGDGDRDVIRGDSYFQSYICHIPRSTIELGVSGALDHLDGMLFPSICDVVRNLSGMWKMLFPERYATYLDLPQSFHPDVGGRFYGRELRRIARDLEARGARPLEDAALEQAIKEENARLRALRRLSSVRREEPWRVPASEAYLVTRAGAALLARDAAALVDEYIEAIIRREPHARDHVRVVLRGSFCEQPPMGLILTLERAGCDIVDDDLLLGFNYLDGDIDEDSGDPVDALVRAFLDKGKATASRYIGDDEKGLALVEEVRRCKADGVIFAAASFCDPALLDQPMLETAVQNAGIPFTSFKFAENTGQFQVIREQAGTFSDAVRLWGSAA
jgi:benzoyl-CoA reductase subunit C